jgi:hypothetical protein
MKEKITIFNADKSSLKIPYSPFGDKTHVFETFESTSHLEMYSVLVSKFVLNIPLTKLTKPLRTFRRKKNLEPLYHEYINYFILDIDDVHNEIDKKTIVKYFKDYKIILGESRSYNGINNFRMKGILFTEDIKLKDAKIALSTFHHDLKHICTIDECVTRKATYNAPIRKNNIIINNKTGSLFEFTKFIREEHIHEIKNQYIGDSFKIPIENLENIEADTIEKLCLKVFQSMDFVAIKNNENESISFKHPVEKKTLGGFFWFSTSPYTMHHNNSTKTVNIFDTIRKLPLAKELMQKEINYDNEFLKFDTNTSVLVVNKKYLKVDVKVNDKILSFLEDKLGLFSIRSAMGTGKSTLIHHIINEAHELDMKVLIITNRISVAEDFAKKYRIKVYNKDKYEIGDSLICQFDSLWRYNIKFFDVVIMDEFISLMMHSRSNLNNNPINIAKFFASFNKKLVIADAFLTGYETFLLSDKETNLHMIDNIYRDPTILFSYDNFNHFVDSLAYHALKNKLTISATSLNFINSLQMLLEKKGLKVVTLTATTPDSTKKLVYELFEVDAHDKWDVLIYSPTLTVGVSNLNRVPYHFHYDSSMSTDVISSIQMIKRTRKTKEIHMFIKKRTNYLKTSYNDIRDSYMSNMGKYVEQNYLFDIDDYGEARLSEIGKKAIKIDTFKNILEFNHKEAMGWLLKYHFLKEPRVIKTTFGANILSKYKKQIKQNNEILLRSNIDQFLMLNNIEKTSLLMDSDVNKTMKVLAGIYNEIKDCDLEIKSKIIDCSLIDNEFINKCKYYKIIFNYTKQIWDKTDVNSLISKSVIEGKNDDINFFNALLKYGQHEIYDEYIPRHINRNKQLKILLDKCGYKLTKQNQPGVIGHRGYLVNPNVKEFYGYIR